MLDVNNLIDKEHREKRLLEMTAAVQVFCQKKDTRQSRKIENPVCLLFMQSDLLNITKGEVLENADGLIKICKLRFKHFSHFFVSSIGKGNEFGKPMRLKPENVLEPLLWAIEKEIK